MLLQAEQSTLVIVDVQVRLVPAIHNHNLLVTRMRWLSEIANELDIPIIVSEQYPKGLGLTVDDLTAVIENALVIEKMHFSAMQEPNFVQAINELRRKQIVLIGIESHVCILQTALDMVAQGLHVFVVEDAIGSRSEHDKQLAIARMRHAGVTIISAEMATYEWLHRSGTDQFRHINTNWIR